jgi:hypothetical protein
MAPGEDLRAGSPAAACLRVDSPLCNRNSRGYVSSAELGGTACPVAASERAPAPPAAPAHRSYEGRWREGLQSGAGEAEYPDGSWYKVRRC